MEDLVLITQVVFTSHGSYLEAPKSPLPRYLAHVPLMLGKKPCCGSTYISTQILGTSLPNPARKMRNVRRKFVALVWANSAINHKHVTTKCPCLTIKVLKAQKIMISISTYIHLYFRSSFSASAKLLLRLLTWRLQCLGPLFRMQLCEAQPNMTSPLLSSARTSSRLG